MLEIILLIYLTKKIGKIASKKGHPLKLFKFLTVLFWFIFEIIGAIVGLLIVGEGLSIYAFALIGAGLGYLIIYLITNGLSQKSPNNLQEDKFWGDLIVFIVVIWMFVSRLFWTIITKFIDNYYEIEWFKSIDTLMSLIWVFIPIGLAFAIKDKSKKIVLFILGGIYLIYGLFEIIMQLIN